MEMRALGRSGLKTGPLVFGGNVFGWTVDEATSFALLDAFVDAGLNAIDTADVYSAWVPGNRGGESESIIGRWLKNDPAKRGKVLILTKVGSEMGPGRQGLSAGRIAEAAEESLRRLGIETIDLYQSHRPDDAAPDAETLGAYAKLIQAGKVRAIGASNYDPAQLRGALDTAASSHLPRYETLQPEYNLYDRASYDGPLRDLAIREGLGVIPYFSLASGFLTGKYRSKADLAGRERGDRVAKYLDARGERILAALDQVGGDLGAKPAEVALAWLMQREGVTAPIASATSRAQLDSLVRAVHLRLPAEAVAALDRASDPEDQAWS